MDGFDLNNVRSVEQAWLGMRSRPRRRIHDFHDAEDVVQEAWLRVLQQASVPHNLSGWLACVAVRLSFERRRANASRVRREREVARPERVEHAADDAEQLALIRRWVADLPQPYRRVVGMRYLEGLEITDIALRLETAPGTVRSQLKRGPDRLRVRVGSPGAVGEQRRESPRRWLPTLALR